MKKILFALLLSVPFLVKAQTPTVVSYSQLGDVVGKIKRSHDTVYQFINSQWVFAYKDSTGVVATSGTPTALRLLIPTSLTSER